ncbi:MAG: hypothetical protein H7Z75_17445 [Ferruginibacter sp.]|nr:hypothetical protein [Cytophagales bacterium]
MRQVLLRPDVQRFIREHLDDDVSRLVLRADQYPGLPVVEIARQIGARQKAKTKLPLWYANERVIFPPVLSLEQSSSQLTATYKARLAEGDTLVDLTGGMGVDAFFLARHFRQVIHVERDAELSALAAHNFRELGADNITCIHGEAETYLARMPGKVDWIYLDPARRMESRSTSNGRVFRLEDCEPDVLGLLPGLQEKAERVLLKTSPMLDIDLALHQLNARAATVLAVENECKEVLYLLPNQPDREATLTAVDWSTTSGGEPFVFTRREEKDAQVTFSEPLAFLYEPNAALLKAGAFRLVATRYGLHKLHPHTHLYTSEARRADFPGRTFAIQTVSKLNKKALLAHLPAGKAHVAVRNFPLSVADIRRQTGIREGGDVYLFAVTDHRDRKVVLVGRKVQ